KLAFELFDKMKSSPSVKPNAITASIFLNYFSMSGDISHAPQVLSYFSQHDFPSTPTDYSILLRFYARFDPTQAVELLKSIQTKEIPVNTELCNAFLSVLLDRKVLPDWRRAM